MHYLAQLHFPTLLKLPLPAVRGNELSQFSITCYFHEDEIETALAGVLPYLADIAAQNVNRAGAAGLSATMLGGGR